MFGRSFELPTGAKIVVFSDPTGTEIIQMVLPHYKALELSVGHLRSSYCSVCSKDSFSTPLMYLINQETSLERSLFSFVVAIPRMQREDCYATRL
jgi:hypothetical protein